MRAAQFGVLVCAQPPHWPISVRLRKLSGQGVPEPSGPTEPDWGDPGAHSPEAVMLITSPAFTSRAVFTHCVTPGTVTVVLRPRGVMVGVGVIVGVFVIVGVLVIVGVRVIVGV